MPAARDSMIEIIASIAERRRFGGMALRGCRPLYTRLETD
jgi:hypothetical protein